jgi:soluble lytic murein transglycosylase-like protein
MAHELSNVDTAEASSRIAVRHGEERRHHDRRGGARGTKDRRRRDRRRATLRSLLFTAFAFVFPHELKSSALPFLAQSTVSSSGPRVSTTIDSFDAVDPKHGYDTLIHEAAETYGVDPALIRSIMQTESDFDPSAVSRAGAMGLMQLMPDIADAYGVEHPFDPRENILAAAQILRELLDFHHGDLTLVLASYNAGAGVVQTYGAVPPFAETQQYVKRVAGLLREARRSDLQTFDHLGIGSSGY